MMPCLPQGNRAAGVWHALLLVLLPKGLRTADAAHCTLRACRGEGLNSLLALSPLRQVRADQRKAPGQG
jgi:hypothetical protein